MKYCGRYSNKINLSVFDEISILYNKQDKELIPFLQEHLNQRVILIIKELEDFSQSEEWRKLNTIHEKYPEFNFALCFKEAGRFEEITDAIKNCIDNLQIPFFMGSVATNFDELNYLCSLGVSDVYLAEDICFDLRRAKRVCDIHKVQIRAFPNVAQGSIKAGPALKKFFIRPEDVESYSYYIDTLEFWGPLDRQEILHKIYTKGKWYGELSDLILDLNFSIDSRYIQPEFARLRQTCERKCLKGDRCKCCELISNISNKLKEIN